MLTTVPAGHMLLLLRCAGDQVDSGGPDAHSGARRRALPDVMHALLPQLSEQQLLRTSQSAAGISAVGKSQCDA